MTVKNVLEILEEWAPLSLAASFDNAGLLVGNENSEVTGIVAALDCTTEAIEYAKSIGANLIVTHHPVIWAPLKTVTENSRVFKLIHSNISLISMHTNLDMAKDGVNDVLAKTLGIKELTPLSNAEGDFYCKMGVLPQETDTESFIKLIKEKLGGNIRYADSRKPIKKVAVCGGAGSDMIAPALLTGCDALVTADCKHSAFITAGEKGLTLIDAGHYNTENIIVSPLASYIEEKTGIKTAVFDYTLYNTL